MSRSWISDGFFVLFCFFGSEPHKSDVEIFSLINCTLWSPKTKKWGFTLLIKRKELMNLNFLFKEGAIPCPCHSLESLPDPFECGGVERSACLSCEACWLVGKEGCVWSGCSSHQCPETPGQACSLVAWESLALLRQLAPLHAFSNWAEGPELSLQPWSCTRRLPVLKWASLWFSSRANCWS